MSDAGQATWRIPQVGPYIPEGAPVPYTRFTATVAAREEAQAAGAPRFVIEAVLGDWVLFGVYAADDHLAAVLRHAATRTDGDGVLTLLRVAHPDGTVAALVDPGTLAERLALVGLVAAAAGDA
jgi:hypothetical protein